MVGVMGLLCGYLVGTLWPSFMSASLPGPAFMALVAVVFSFVVAYIAYRGVNGSTAVNIAINIIQITALVVFSVLALGYRMNHPVGSVAYQFDSTSGDAYNYEFATEKQTVNGQATVELLKVLLRMTAERHGVAAKVIATTDDLDRIAADDAADVPAMHGWRRELFGEKALALKHGRLALAIERGRVVTFDKI